MDNAYKGYVELTDGQAAEFYTNNSLPIDILENQYVLIGTDAYCYQKGCYRRVEYPTIKSDWAGEIKPRNIEQKCAMDMLLDETSAIKLITGSWGTGKSLLLISAALAGLEEGRFDKIVWIRNNVQVKDTDQIGALPGTSYDKLLPYLGPFIDHAGGVEGVERLIEDDKLEVIALGFLRGRSIRNSVIISSEAENLTKEHIQLLLGRIDKGSNLWLDADTRQRDRVAFEKSRGVETLIDRLKGEELFGYVHLIKSERSKAAALADKLND